MHLDKDYFLTRAQLNILVCHTFLDCLEATYLYVSQAIWQAVYNLNTDFPVSTEKRIGIKANDSCL